MDKSRVIIAVLLVAGMLLAPMIVQGQLTYDQAEDRFQQLGCTSCHNGGTAPPFDQVVQMIQSWSQNYNSIDEAVAAEVRAFGQNYQTYEEMMQQMAQFSGTSLDNMQDLYQFFIDVFEGNVQVGGGEDQADQQEAPVEEAPQESGSLASAFAIGVVLAIIIAGTAYMFAKKK